MGGIVMRRHAFLPVLLLGACTSSYQTVRLDSSGEYPEAKRGQAVGVPFTLTKPEFTIKKIEGSDPERFQVTVNYVPDPTQRYALRLDPTWLSKIDFNMALGPSGGLTSTSADVKDQIIPFTASVVNLAASLAKLGTALSVESTDMAGCLAIKGPGALAICTVQQTPTCSPDARKEIVGRIDRAVRIEKEDKGGSLDTLFARTDDEEACFTSAAKLLGDQVEARALGVATAFDKEARKAGIPEPTPDNVSQPLVQLGLRSSTLLAEAATKRDVTAVRKLVYATQLAAEKGESQYLKNLLKLDTQPTAANAAILYTALKAIKPAEKKKPEGDAVKKAAESQPAEEGEAKRVIAADLMVEAATGDRVQKAFAGIATMSAGQWRARYIPVLQRELADAERSALRASSAARAAEARRDAGAARKKLAELVNMAPDLARLERIESILDAVPRFDARDRHSRIAEYQGYARQAAEIRTEMATRLAAAVATEKAPKKEAVLPIALPWVSRKCIDQSKQQDGWIYTAGAEAADYVIVIRSGNKDIDPPPAPKAGDLDAAMPECGA